VLMGELPHRDFDLGYTGGQSYLNAFAFWLLGTNLATLRIVLFIFFLAWVPAVYAIASRFVSPPGAGAATLLAVAWSVANYPAAVTSWYNLFFATFGTLAVLRYLETGTGRWLFLAGACGGASCLFKIAGLYYVAAVFLFLLYREQGRESARQIGSTSAGRVYFIFLNAVVLFMVAALCAVVRGSLSSVAVVQFVLPGAGLGGLCLWREFAGGGASARQRFIALWRMLLPFGIGVLVPIAIFLVPYIRTGSLSDFFNGAFVQPLALAHRLAHRPPGFGPIRIIATLILVLLIFAAMYPRARTGWWARIPLLAAMGFVLMASAKHPGAYRFAWSPLTFLIPLGVLAGVLLLGNSRTASDLSFLRQQQVMLLLCVTAMCSLVQLPLPAAVYFCYVAPLLVLTLVALFSTRQQTSHFLIGSLVIFYIAFAVFRFTPTILYDKGWSFRPDRQTQRLLLPRAGGLRVDPDDADEYEHLISLVQEHAGGSAFMYCAPDCPEVYFLSGLRNPTRTFFDYYGDSAHHTERVLNTLEAHQVKVVAIFSTPGFSGPMAADLQAALRQRFPASTRLCSFEVRWRP